MKKLLLVLTVVLLANVARAEGFGFHFGPKIGYQTATLSLKSDDIKANYNSNFTAGIFGRITLHNFIVQPELLYFKSGQIFNLKGLDILNDFNPRIEMTQQNLALPIFIGYQFFDFKLLKVRANAGPVMYFVLDQKNKCNYTNQELKVEANNMTWGAALNLGVDVLWFTLDINYSFGLSDLINKETLTISDKHFELDKTKQSIFTVTLGFKLISLGL